MLSHYAVFFGMPLFSKYLNVADAKVFPQIPYFLSYNVHSVIRHTLNFWIRFFQVIKLKTTSESHFQRRSSVANPDTTKNAGLKTQERLDGWRRYFHFLVYLSFSQKVIRHVGFLGIVTSFVSCFQSMCALIDTSDIHQIDLIAVHFKQLFLP